MKCNNSIFLMLILISFASSFCSQKITYSIGNDGKLTEITNGNPLTRTLSIKSIKPMFQVTQQESQNYIAYDMQNFHTTSSQITVNSTDKNIEIIAQNNETSETLAQKLKVALLLYVGTFSYNVSVLIKTKDFCFDTHSGTIFIAAVKSLVLNETLFLPGQNISPTVAPLTIKFLLGKNPMQALADLLIIMNVFYKNKTDFDNFCNKITSYTENKAQLRSITPEQITELTKEFNTILAQPKEFNTILAQPEEIPDIQPQNEPPLLSWFYGATYALSAAPYAFEAYDYYKAGSLSGYLQLQKGMLFNISQNKLRAATKLKIGYDLFHFFKPWYESLKKRIFNIFSRNKQ